MNTTTTLSDGTPPAGPLSTDTAAADTPSRGTPRGDAVPGAAPSAAPAAGPPATIPDARGPAPGESAAGQPAAAEGAAPAETAGEGAVLAVRDLRIRDEAGGREIVRGVSFELHPGRALGIVGESGSGKTLTCRAVLGILPDNVAVSAGSIRIAGRDTAGLTARQWTDLRGSTISAVFQDPASYLNPSIRVGAQIAEVIRVKLGLGRRAARRRAVELLAAVHLRDPELVYGQYAFELSGGMLQRVLIAAAIAAGPRVLVADEATTALDVTVQAEILDLLADLRERTGLALVLVSHDLAVVAQVCDEVLVMRRGEVVEHGPTADVLYRPRHEYTRLLIAEHEQYGLERYLADIPDRPPAGPPAGPAAGSSAASSAGSEERKVRGGVR